MFKSASATLLAVTVTLSGCAGPVAIPPPTPSTNRVTTICSELARQLPSAVMNLVKRPTEPDSYLIAAWGNPPVTLRCGVGAPPGLKPTSRLVTIANVDWLPEQRSAGYVFVTTGRVANVEVSVPDAYQPETQALDDLANAVRAADPLSV